MIVIRATTAVVLWRVRRPTPRLDGAIVCLNDQFAVPLKRDDDAGLRTALQQMAAHSVQIGGPILQLADISELP